MNIFNYGDKKVYVADRDYSSVIFRFVDMDKVSGSVLSGLYGGDKYILCLEKEKRKQAIYTPGTLKSSSKLYFDESAIFPRYKLADSDFKRCIKKDKADLLVFGLKKQQVYDSYGTIKVYETSSSFILINSYHSDDFINFIKSRASSDAFKEIYDGYIMEYPKDSILLKDPGIPAILDTDLDKEINKTFSTISYDDLLDLETYFNSPDKDTRDLGLKLLTSFNIDATPYTIACFLHLNPKWTNLKSVNSVAVKTMLTNLSLDKSNIGRQLIYIFDSIHEKYSARTNQDDIDLCHKYIKPYVTKYIENELIGCDAAFNNSNFKLDLNVEIA